MKYLILIDREQIKDLDKVLIDYLLKKANKGIISFKPFIESVDINWIRNRLNNIDIDNKKDILFQITEDKKLVYVLDSEETYEYEMIEKVLTLIENHPAMVSYMIKGECD